MTATPHEPSAHPVSMRAIVERLPVPEGIRVEILGGTIVMSPAPSFKHGAIVRRLYDQMRAQLPVDRVAQQGYAIDSPGDQDDYVIPDLMVVPAACENEEGWLLPTDAADLVAEVASNGNRANDTVVKVAEYASWRVPIYLLIDPGDGTVTVHYDPEDGEYRTRHRARFGERIELPKPLADVAIDTSAFPRYADRRTH